MEQSAGSNLLRRWALGGEGLWDQPWSCSVVEAGQVCVCVCAGVGARQGGVPDPSTLPSKLMQLRSKIHLSYS